ncbi:hypothetical protein GTW20_00050 [Nocardiopsis alba]|uniref:Uncharacterized protein n=1 Tax=Nocardiopsis alba TaxID=53437 RepID=A0A7K2ILN3_9ACTN|nr:hypothetical protein [Nocardiopsis alba]MYR30695.1 hypothetical protein [Nocardiopsis alba]
MHTTLINHAGRTVHIKTGGEGGTYSAQISPDGKAWPLIEKFSTTFARDMFAKGYIAHMTEQGYAPKGRSAPSRSTTLSTPNNSADLLAETLGELAGTANSESPPESLTTIIHGGHMGYELYRHVLNNAPAEIDAAARLVLAVIADDANEKTRRSYLGMDLLSHRTGLLPDSASKALRRLAKAGFEIRVPVGTDKNGKPVFAMKGHRTVYLIPVFPERFMAPKPGREADLQGRKARTRGRPKTAQRPDPRPQRPDESPQSPDERQTLFLSLLSLLILLALKTDPSSLSLKRPTPTRTR